MSLDQQMLVPNKEISKTHSHFLFKFCRETTTRPSIICTQATKTRINLTPNESKGKFIPYRVCAILKLFFKSFLQFSIKQRNVTMLECLLFYFLAWQLTKACVFSMELKHAKNRFVWYAKSKELPDCSFLGRFTDTRYSISLIQNRFKAAFGR